MPTLIKRYANRKLYNTATSRYITLNGIAELLDEGEEVRVVDNESGEDITQVALSQILVDSGRKNSALPRSLLQQLVERGGDLVYGALKRGVGEAQEGIEDIQGKVKKLVRGAEDRSTRLSDWMAIAPKDLDRAIQRAVERVFTLLDLARRSDIDTLNKSLERLAEAVDRLERGGPARREAAARSAAAPDAAAKTETSDPA
jgi:polyhydroxyalkanoate synthesis repressor PhaR